MSASPDRPAARIVLPRFWALYPLFGVPLLLATVSWWFTEPLADRGGRVATPVSAPAAEATVVPDATVEWPEGRLDGVEAKRRLHDMLVVVTDRLNRIDDYTALFRKQERIKGRLGPVMTLEMKVRHRPFAVYLKFVEPQQGKEVVYAEGHHDNKVIAHGSGLTRLLVPRLAVAPDHPLALADARHPVTEAGIANLANRLLRFRRMDLDDPEAGTVLDRLTDEQGRERYRSVHTHPKFHPDRPFARVEVLYDPETRFPVDIRSYDWPAPGYEGDLQLAEHYAYETIRVDADLTALDFDPANPDYSFHRY